jgi:hypothetical protein
VTDERLLAEFAALRARLDAIELSLNGRRRPPGDDAAARLVAVLALKFAALPFTSAEAIAAARADTSFATALARLQVRTAVQLGRRLASIARRRHHGVSYLKRGPTGMFWGVDASMTSVEPATTSTTSRR